MHSANDSQVGGTHYSAKTQHWDYVVQGLHNRYLEGNITKYVSRHRKKGNPVQDLEKAMHYTHKLIEEFTAGRIRPPERSEFDVHALTVSNSLNSAETFVCKRIAPWTSLKHLEQIVVNISILRKDALNHVAAMDAIKCGATASYVNQDQ